MKIAIIGAGFAGLSAAKTLKKFNPTVFDKNPNFQFTPSLHFCINNPEYTSNIQFPIKDHYYFINKQVIDINHTTVITNNQSYEFDKIIIATGSKTNYFQNKSFEKNALPVKTISDITKINTKLEKAKNVHVIGGGYTGVEVAAMIPGSTIIHSLQRLLAYLSPRASQLSKKKIKTLLNQKVTHCSPRQITLNSGKKIKTDLTIISAGVKPETSLVKKPKIRQDLSLMSNKNIYLCGDCAPTGALLTAHNAINEGKRAAQNILGKKLIHSRDSHLLAVSLGLKSGFFSYNKLTLQSNLVGFAKKTIEKSVILKFSGNL